MCTFWISAHFGAFLIRSHCSKIDKQRSSPQWKKDVGILLFDTLTHPRTEQEQITREDLI